jgi:hypothetical protein
VEPPTHYDHWFNRLTAQGASTQDAVLAVINRYLDGKSGTADSPSERDAALWSSAF